MSTTKTAYVFSAAAALFNARKKPLIVPHFVETITDTDGRTGWHIKSHEGKILATSAVGYHNDADLKADIRQTIDALIEWYNAG